MSTTMETTGTVTQSGGHSTNRNSSQYAASNPEQVSQLSESAQPLTLNSIDNPITTDAILPTNPQAPPTTSETQSPTASPASSPSIIIPPPHLPLRKKTSDDLRLRTSPLYTPKNDSPQQQTIGSLVQRLRPETQRWSKEGALALNIPTGSPPSPPDRGLNTRSIIASRPSTAIDFSVEEQEDTLSPLLRPSTSISEYAYSRPSLRASTTDPLPEKSGSSRTTSTFWRDGGVANLRESIYSATLTNGSSNFNTSGSSVFTARSSRSTRDSSGLDWQKTSDDELSIDDCIDMYANGFRDDPERPPIPNIPAHLLNANDEQAESPQRDNAKRDSNTRESVFSFQPSLRTGKSHSSDTLISPSRGSDTSTSHRRQARVARDRYGFKHESQHVSANRYAAWYKGYNKHLERRRQKWTHLMNLNGLHSNTYPEVFPPRSSEVKRYIRKGIPPEWRGAAWFFYGDGAAWLEAHPGLYNALRHKASQGAVTSSDRDHIERDLNRTFPDNIHFKPDPPSSVSSLGVPAAQDETELIKSLRRLLEAYAIHHPTVGYCQSLNFLAGHLLLFMQLSFPTRNYEERAFALLCILTEKYLPGTHGLVLEGANVDIGVLMTILQETMPSLWAKLDDNGNASSIRGQRKSSRASITLKTNTDRLPTVSLATTAWFMSCFVSTLPIESTCRVWDCLWYEGSKTIFRTALAIFKIGEKQIKVATDAMEVFQIVQNLPKELLDANELMEVATMKTGHGIGSRLGAGTPGFGGLSQKTVEGRREERRAYSKGVRERSQSGVGYRDADGNPIFALPPMPEQPVQSLVRRVTLKRLKSMKRIA